MDMLPLQLTSYHRALEDFKRARQQAEMRQLMARLTGHSADLLSFDRVRRELGVSEEAVERGVREIPLEAIIGSVGRASDFTRDFLPKRDNDAERWARIKAAAMDMRGMKPIDVYQVGEVFFVIDGNHRVSVARQLGATAMMARVFEIETRAPFTPDDDPEELLAKARLTAFLSQTNLDRMRPGADLRMNLYAEYPALLEQIEQERARLTQAKGREVPANEAAASWYDNEYVPVLKLIREHGALRHMPDWTEADLYVLISEHWTELEEALGWEVDLPAVVADFASHEVETTRGLRRLRPGIPPALQEGPSLADWRKAQWRERDWERGQHLPREQRLFADHLVALRGSPHDWKTLQQAIWQAQMEGDRLLGLHVVPRADQIDTPAVDALREKFDAMCAEGGVEGEFSVAVGRVTDTIIKRAAFADIVITTLVHPPGKRALDRLSHGFNQLVQRCPRPLVAFPSGGEPSLLDRILLAYDGSPKAWEALFVATYLAARWPGELTVITVETEYTPASALDEAREYLEEHGIHDARYILRDRPIAEAILTTAETYRSNALIMGGFGFRPLKHLVLGSTVDIILRTFRQPILICR